MSGPRDSPELHEPPLLAHLWVTAARVGNMNITFEASKERGA